MPLPYPTSPGDVDHIVADDHAVLERQFQHVEEGRANRRVLADQVGTLLAMHTAAEEKVLYPALTRAGLRTGVDRARNGHLELRRLLVVLERTDPGMSEFDHALLQVIAETRAHTSLLEEELLPEFRERTGPGEVARLGPTFVDAKRSAPTRTHPTGPLSSSGRRLTDPGTALVDRARDRTTGRRDQLVTDASGLLNPQAQAVIDALSALRPLPVDVLPPREARTQPGLHDAVRAVMAGRGLTAPEPVASVTDLTVPDGAGRQQTLRVYAPKDTPAGGRPRPVILWVHGGGWVLSDVETYDPSCRGLAGRTGALVVSPEYRRAPEAPFPAAHDDVLAAYRWTVEHAAELGADPGRIGIGGESVGATMAAATCLHAADAGGPTPAALVCVYPLTTARQYGDSMADAADARPLSRPVLSWMLRHAFAGVPGALGDGRVDLLGLPARDLAQLPPTLVITAERDPLRSQGEELARRLAAAGVPTAASRYDGVMHDFFGALAVLDEADRAHREVAAHYRAAFSG